MRFGPVSESDEESDTNENDSDSDSLNYNQLGGLGPINVMTHLIDGEDDESVGQCSLGAAALRNLEQ